MTRTGEMVVPPRARFPPPAPVPIRSGSMAGQVHLEFGDRRATIILDNPDRLNAISAEMWEGLTDATVRISGHDDIRAVVIRGAGERAFASGADISQFGESRADASANTAYDSATRRATEALAGLPMPVVASIHGYCIGGGLAVALTADLRIASHDAAFAIPAARLGLGYAARGIAVLLDLVGPSATKEIFFTARRFDARRALDMGLVNRVVERHDLDRAVDEMVDQICSNAPLTLRAVKAAVSELLIEPPDRDLDRVDTLVRECFGSEDYAEGVAAFLEKRRPEFRGR